MILPSFKLHQPGSIDEAMAAAAACGGDFDYVAGGTDLLQNYKNRLNPRGNLIDLTRLPGLAEIRPGRIGGLATLAALERSAAMSEHYPGLVEAAALIASPLVRQTATVGGNVLVDTRCYYFNQSPFCREAMTPCLKAGGSVCLVVPQAQTCYATFSADLPPVFMALDASYVFRGAAGERRIKAREFYQGDGIARHVKRREEILTYVEFPPESSGLASGYRKLRIRDTFDYPLMGVAAALRLEAGRLAEAKVVVNAVNMVPLDMAAQVAPFLGRDFDAEARRALAEDVRDAITPYKNVFLSVAYRKAMISVFLERLFADLAG